MNPEMLRTQENFEYWLASMDDMLEAFFSQLPSSIRSQLDYSPGSLDAVERLILERYPSTASMLHKEERDYVNALACYIGETYRKAVGGKWSIRLDDPKFVYFGIPILVNSKGFAAPECPLTLATAAADRRRGTYLRVILDNAIRRSAASK